MKYLPLIDGRSGNWEKQAAQYADAGRNFAIYLANPGVELPRLCVLIKAPETCKPEPIQKWILYALRQVLEPAHFAFLFEALQKGQPAYLIEHLSLFPTRPPTAGKYLVYCELLGMVSDHAYIEEAKRALAAYYATFTPTCQQPLAGIYHWDGDQWTQTRYFF